MGLFDGFNVKELVENSEKFEKENANNGGDFEEIPDGKYEVAVIDMDFITSKSGKPMIKYEFQVVAGAFENQHIWIYNVIDPKSEYFELNVRNARVFLASMFEGLENAPVITTETLLTRDVDLIRECFEFAEDNYEYLLKKETKKSKNGKEFVNYSIKNIYPLE